MGIEVTLTHRTAWRVVLLLLLGAGARCSAPSDTAVEHKDAAQDNDAAEDNDAAVTNCKKSDMIDACVWTGCQEDVASYCVDATGGCADWTSDPTVLCATYPHADYIAVAESCGSYQGLATTGVDQGGKSYYDAKTGKLVAIVFHDYEFVTAKCVAGPADFVEPICDSWLKIDCSDAGTGGADGGGAAGQSFVAGAAGLSGGGGTGG